MEFNTQKVLITGAASGLGAATAKVLADAGAKVAILDRNPDGAAYAKSLDGHFEEVDVTDDTSVTAAINNSVAAMGGLTAVVNCAGIATAEKTIGRDGAHRLESFQRTIDINLIGSFNVARQAAVIMAQNEPDADNLRGVIVNTASVAAYDGQKGQAAYAASKAAIAGLSLPMARDLARDGIRVMAIAPGIFKTEMLIGLGDAVMDSLSAVVPCPARLGHPSEYGDLAKFIIASPYLNGTTIRLDGAIRLP